MSSSLRACSRATVGREESNAWTLMPTALGFDEAKPEAVVNTSWPQKQTDSYESILIREVKVRDAGHEFVTYAAGDRGTQVGFLLE
jgi:hypothetical protein